MKRSIPSPSPATVLAALALFVSLGGVSYAVATGSIDSRELRDNSIQSRDVRDGGLQSRDLRDGSVQGRDVANGTLRGHDVRNGALGGVDLRDGSLAGRDLAENSLGDREIDEPQLDVNRLGDVDASAYVKRVRRVETATASDGAPVKVAPPASCPRGKRLIGGGARVVAAGDVPVALTRNGPNGGIWEAAAYATAPTGNWRLVNVAICG
jgi:hypothetical protein